jgi:hypothetical protein
VSPMDRERAEAHLRMLAEDEIRHWIEVIASGRSAQARAILPVRWQASRPAI